MLDRRFIELLAPAKNADYAIAAILAGADAVYMGAANFGARQAAGNSYDDIERVCDFAHSYGARVNIALNTIFTDAELASAVETAHEVYNRGANALIIQDMGLLMHPLPPIPIHASTQCHIADVQKAQFLEAAGFDTLVLARELSLGEIAEISQAVNTRIECFIHGALCVSYSGQCYLSHAIGGRSGNRGECAQPCRLKYSLKDANGRELVPPAHYLSLKDLNRSAGIGELLDAGVSSFKIEGRLKSADYVKNITAHYRKILDSETQKRGLMRSSYGKSSHSFIPNPHKSFNRDFCEYFLHGQNEKIGSFKSPKSRGEYIGTAGQSIKNGFLLSGKSLSNGDGIMIENPDGQTFGTNVQYAEGKNIVCGRDCPKIEAGAKIWRNKDIRFEVEIAETAIRAMPVSILMKETDCEWRFVFTHIESGIAVEEKLPKAENKTAENAERAKEMLSQNLCKLGGSKFAAASLDFDAATFPFLKASQINSIRRAALEKLEARISSSHDHKRKMPCVKKVLPDNFNLSALPCDYRANVSNSSAEEFYKKSGISILEKALEAATPHKGKTVMLTRHCILRELDLCKKEGRFPREFSEPLRLENNETKLEICFKCAECKMELKTV